MSFSIPTWRQPHSQTNKTSLSSAADKSGLPPGTLIHIGEKHESECKITVTQYNADTLVKHEITSISELKQLQNLSLIHISYYWLSSQSFGSKWMVTVGTWL